MRRGSAAYSRARAGPPQSPDRAKPQQAHSKPNSRQWPRAVGRVPAPRTVQLVCYSQGSSHGGLSGYSHIFPSSPSCQCGQSRQFDCVPGFSIIITKDNCVCQRIKGQCCALTVPLAVLRSGAVQGRSPALPFILSLSDGKVILYYPNFQIILEKFLITVQEYFRIRLLR